MTVETYPPPEQTEPNRDRWGRPLVIPPDGGKPVAYTRCTTFVDCLDDKWMLQEWQQRMVALGMSQRPDLLTAYQAIAGDLMVPKPPVEVKRKANALCEQAREAAASSAAATVGTALHAFTERLDRGLELGHVPDPIRADLDAYARATRTLSALHIEQFTVNDDLMIGGTPDRVVEYNGRTYIADLKTGSIQWSALKIAMQLAVYAHADLYDVPTGRRTPLPDVDQSRAIVIHLPAGTGECTLHWVDVGAGWDAVQVAAQVRKWRKRGKGLLSELVPDEQLTLPTGDADARPPVAPVAADTPDSLPNRIASAATADDLTRLWREHKHEWTGEHTDLASARKRLLEQSG